MCFNLKRNYSCQIKAVEYKYNIFIWNVTEETSEVSHNCVLLYLSKSKLQTNDTFASWFFCVSETERQIWINLIPEGQHAVSVD